MRRPIRCRLLLAGYKIHSGDCEQTCRLLLYRQEQLLKSPSMVSALTGDSCLEDERVNVCSVLLAGLWHETRQYAGIVRIRCYFERSSQSDCLSELL